MWSAQEKRVQKIDRLVRSLLIQGLPNDIYSLIDINKTGKDLWDALARHMLGSEYDLAHYTDAASESFSPSPILVKDSDSLMEEIDLFCTLGYPMPPGIEDKDYDSERDILILKDLSSNNTFSFAKKKSFYFDIPLFSRPSAKPPDGDTGILNIKMMGDISDEKAFVQKLMITLAPHQEKSPDLLSHRCETVKKFNTHRSHLNKCSMLIHGQNNPPLDVLLVAKVLIVGYEHVVMNCSLAGN
nr:hypothetical protein [Tanacetum cinerariifolium]